MRVQVERILSFLDSKKFDYEYKGDRNISINNFCSLYSLKKDCITWVKNKEAYNKCDLLHAANILIVIGKSLEPNLTNKSINLIICNNPKEVFFSILSEFFKQKEYKKYISSNSTVETSTIGKDVYIGHYSYIGESVQIGNNVVIKNNVSIEGKVTIGNNTTIHSGVVIGTDGFGYFKNRGNINKKVPHYGGVVIGDNVEIGPNTCIDRGTLDDTIIENNVKISRLCLIAHNVTIKENSMVAAFSMLGGSVILEKDSYIAPGVMIKNQITIGRKSLVGMGAVVIKNVDDNKVVVGVPAKAIKENYEEG